MRVIGGHVRRSHWVSICVVTCGTVLAGCSGDSLKLPEDEVIVTTSTGTKLTGMYPAVLTVFTGEMSWTLTMIAGSATDSWSLIATLTEEQAVSAEVTLPVVAGPVPTVGNASVKGTTGEWASAGTITVERSKGMLHGVATLDPDTASATFQGRYAVSCWVPRSSLGDAGISSSGGDADPDIEDNPLTTPVCSEYRALLQ